MCHLEQKFAGCMKDFVLMQLHAHSSQWTECQSVCTVGQLTHGQHVYSRTHQVAVTPEAVSFTQLLKAP